jgi:hypothetical protein
MKIMSYVFWRVPLLIKLPPEKTKGTVIWPLVGMFGGSISLDCFGGFLDQIMTAKKVQSSGHWLQCRIVLVGSSLCFLVGSLIKLQITTKKKVQSSGLFTPFATHVTFYFYYVCT